MYIYICPEQPVFSWLICYLSDSPRHAAMALLYWSKGSRFGPLKQTHISCIYPRQRMPVTARIIVFLLHGDNGKSFKFTIHLHGLIPPQIGNLMIPVLGNQYKPSFATVPVVDQNHKHCCHTSNFQELLKALSICCNLLQTFAKAFNTQTPHS